MVHDQDRLWRLLFSAAIAVLMLGILLIRSEPVPSWVLFVYPGVGALLANIASRTSPSDARLARFETSIIAAAAIFILAALVNVLLIDALMQDFLAGEILSGPGLRRISFLALPAISVLLWWSLERRLARIRVRKHVADADGVS